MRSSKPRSRNKSNRNNNRSVGNIVNRVFDSSGPEGKVRGTPQQIIEKYNQLARDAQLSNDRVAFENFQQHAEHYTRMLGEAMKEQEARREAQERERAERQAQNQQNQQNNQNAQKGNDRNQQRGDRGAGDQPMLAEPRAEGSASNADTGVVDTGNPDSGLVETPESKPSRPRRPRKPRNQASQEDAAPQAPEAPEAAE